MSRSWFVSGTAVLIGIAFSGCAASGGTDGRSMATGRALQSALQSPSAAYRQPIPDFCRRDPGLPQCLRERLIDRRYAAESRAAGRLQ